MRLNVKKLKKEKSAVITISDSDLEQVRELLESNKIAFRISNDGVTVAIEQGVAEMTSRGTNPEYAEDLSTKAVNLLWDEVTDTLEDLVEDAVIDY